MFGLLTRKRLLWVETAAYAKVELYTPYLSIFHARIYTPSVKGPDHLGLYMRGDHLHVQQFIHYYIQCFLQHMQKPPSVSRFRTSFHVTRYSALPFSWHSSATCLLLESNLPFPRINLCTHLIFIPLCPYVRLRKIL